MEVPIINMNTIIDKMISENKIYRFASELQYTESDERKEMLRDILRKLQINNISNEEKEKDKSEKAKDVINTLSEKINKGSLQKKWNKLTKDQKMERIKLFFEKNKDSKLNEEKILQMVDDDTLLNKYIEYDDVETEIKSINIIKK